MLLKRTGIPYSSKTEDLFMYVMKDIARCGCIKGFVYRFMYVRVRENIACKLIRHSDSIFDGFPNIYFLIDFKTRLEENEGRDVEKHTESCKSEEQHCFTPKDSLQNIY